MVKKTRKLLHRTHKRAKKKAKFILKHPFLIPVTTFFVVVFFGMGMFVTVGATSGGAKDTKIVNVFSDGENQTHTTRAKTVGELLERLNIVTIPEDIVEPTRESVILENDTQINVYRARPVELVDGDRTITVLSAQRSPRLVAADAGVELLPEDDIELSTRDNTLLNSSASEQLVIDRSVEVKLTVYGVLTTIRTTSDTLAEFLLEENIQLKQNETTQPDNQQAPIVDGMLISINRPGVKTLAITESIPFITETISDAELTVGQSEIRTEGVNGEQAVIYEIVEENGIETARRQIQTVVTKNPVNQVRARGTKQATLSSSINVSADKVALMAAAGISPSDYAYVDFIISKESNWRPGALNAGSGAYGLCQSLPASKMASAGADYLTNPVTQLRWCSSYTSRYGGWQNSYNAWLAQGWW
jgi:resuscitation-promoting factor RpfB